MGSRDTVQRRTRVWLDSVIKTFVLAAFEIFGLSTRRVDVPKTASVVGMCGLASPGNSGFVHGDPSLVIGDNASHSFINHGSSQFVRTRQAFSRNDPRCKRVFERSPGLSQCDLTRSETSPCRTRHGSPQAQHLLYLAPKDIDMLAAAHELAR